MKNILFCFIILLMTMQSYSQKKQINNVIFYDLIKQGGIIENYEIIDSGNVKFLFDTINKDIIIKNCTFHRFVMVGLNLDGNLFIDSCLILGSRLGNDDLEFLFCSIKGNVIIDHTCNANNECKIYFNAPSSIQNLIIKNSQKYIIRNDKNSIDCSVILANLKIKSLFIMDVKLESLSCINSEFSMPVDLRSYRSTKFENLSFERCTFHDDLCLDNVDVLKDFSLVNNNYEKGLSIAGMRFDMLRSQIDWQNAINSIDSIAPSWFSWNMQANDLNTPGNFIHINQSKQISLNQVANSYRILVSYLRNQNKRNEADSAYILYREYETKLLYSNWRNNKFSSRNIIDLLFSYTIRWFSNYSTDFYYAIIHIFYIIIAFGLIYFMREAYLSHMEIKYLILRILNKFNLKNRRTRIRLRYSLHKLERSNQLNNIFIDNYSILYNLKHVIIKPLFRSQLISTNFFVTLGYAGVQARGRMKYIAVIEGLIGWFFLILFTSCLLSNYIEIN